jgi:hypothetical protein
VTSLLDQTLTGFLDQAAARQPAPGGGSAAALTAALSAGLVAMAACCAERADVVELDAQPVLHDLQRKGGQRAGLGGVYARLSWGQLAAVLQTALMLMAFSLCHLAS